MGLAMRRSTGESYAGIYIPTLVEEIMANSTFINLKGFAIGDGCLGTESKGACGVDDAKIRMEFLYEHGQVRGFASFSYFGYIYECMCVCVGSGRRQ